MKIDKKYLIEKSTSKDETRYNLCNPYLTIDKTDKTKGKLTATDGRMLAQIDVETDETDAPGYVPVEAIKSARKEKNWTPEISLNGDAQVNLHTHKITFARPDGFTFPDVEKVFPVSEPKVKIAFDPWKLWELAQALGLKKGDALSVEIRDPETAIKVRGSAGTVGLLMPMKYKVEV